ncbi:RhoGEF domain protein [Dictyocaulus viviparus]|uniref:RhoGEF domain protein n=1 Tax=Dictyocaulus viviparus TaxID=29172 RepID=A0A0D8Y343_DICVI|nr:RhoGEF domain protein [Dictyocaulus viviparus]
MTPYAPEGADVGDQVVSVDGKIISRVSSAADVERMLREGRVIRLRKCRNPPKNSTQSLKNIPQESLRSTTKPITPLAEITTSKAKSEEKLLRSIDELLQTEKKYVDDLKEMIDRYLSIPSVREIMESALRLQKMQVSFLDSLEEAVGDIGSQDLSTRPLVRDAIIRVCALFVNRCSDFKVYAEYAAAYLRLLQEITSRKDLLSSLEAANSSKEQHSSYESRMIKPVQRVVQYPLLLRAIQSCCDQDSLQAKQVEIALQKMQTLAEYVNEMQRVHEQYAPHIAIIRRQNELLFKEKGLRIDIRDLLVFAHVQWINTEKSMQDYVIFIFQTLVLLLPRGTRRECKVKWMHVLPINEVQIEDDQPDEPTLIVVHAKDNEKSSNEKAYHLTCCQLSLKQQLVRSMKKARSNFCREIRRPLSGSSQSDGGYGSETVKDRKSS